MSKNQNPLSGEYKFFLNGHPPDDALVNLALEDMQKVTAGNNSGNPIISDNLKRELQQYLSQLESLVFSEGTSSFDEMTSSLIDCIYALLEAGQ